MGVSSAVLLHHIARPAGMCLVGTLAFAGIVASPLLAQERMLEDMPERSRAQVRVILAVEGDDEALFRSGLAAALRGLGDIEIVTDEEDYDVMVHLAIMCGDMPDRCDRPSSWFVTTTVHTPLTPDWLYAALGARNQEVTIGGQPMSWRALQNAVASLRSFREVESASVSRWGRNNYEQALGRLVSRLDTECFETIRVKNRYFKAQERGEYELMSQLSRAMSQRSCSGAP